MQLNLKGGWQYLLNCQIKMKIKKSIIIVSFILVLAIGSIAFSEPGTETDPLITLSYLNTKIQEVKDYVDTKISGISTGGGTTEEAHLVVVELSEGQKLIGQAGAEIILRGGKATAITSPQGGLADVTAGVDIKSGEDIPANHLLIIARSDGRGVLATSESTVYLMVRGSYSVE